MTAAFHRTSHLMAETLRNVGRQRPHQDVRVICTACSGSVLGPRYDVFVAGDYYRVREITLQQLRQGVTPAELELEPIDDEEEDFD
jgi:hypothetical protein